MSKFTGIYRGASYNKNNPYKENADCLVAVFCFSESPSSPKDWVIIETVDDLRKELLDKCVMGNPNNKHYIMDIKKALAALDKANKELSSNITTMDSYKFWGDEFPVARKREIEFIHRRYQPVIPQTRQDIRLQGLTA